MPKALDILVKILAAVTLLVLLATAILSPAWAARPEDVKVAAPTPIPTPQPAATAVPTNIPTATPEPTATPTPSPTPEPTPEYFTVHMVGDCTLASYPEIKARADSYESIVGTNWAYPFENTRELFSADEMTIVNLECSISDQSAWSGSTFSFLAPAESVKVLTNGSVEFATTSNNHAMDFGEDIYNDTAAALDSVGVGHAGDGEGQLYLTENGIAVGVYATYNGHYPDANTVAAGVRSLKESGADIVVVSAHWGNEASYYENENQIAVAHAAIDAGANIVFGHGPHRVEPYEEYNGGIIFYSLGNFIFGGNTNPADMDCIIGEATICRDVDGTISLSGFRAIPASISSRSDGNDYCPTVFEEGTPEYARCLSKADGSFTGSNNVIDYSFMHPDEDVTE